MQVSVETKGSLGRSMTVELPEERIASAVEERLKSMTRTSRIQGFRPGKAPLRVIKQRFGSQVRQEVVDKLVNSSFHEAAQQEDLKPVGRPLIDPLQEEVGNGLSYTATFEVMPEIKLNPIEELRLEKPVCEIEEVDVDRMIEKLRRQNRTFQVVERAAGNGDLVNINFQGLVDGEELESLKAEEVDIEIGEDRLFPGLDQGLDGASSGQSLELKLTLPEDFYSAELAGKPALFQIEVNKVMEAVWPDLDEAFFENFGVSDGGEQAFRQEIRNHMNRELQVELRKRYRDSIMNALHDANEIDVPDVMVNIEAERMQQLLALDLEKRGIAKENISQLAALEDFKNTARRQVALQLLTAELIRTRELQAKPEKVREIIETWAQSYDDSEEFINWHYRDKESMARVESIALEDEVIECISSLGKVKELSLAFDELMNKRQTNN